LSEQLIQAAHSAQKAGQLPNMILPEIYLEHPQKTEHGDYASSFPLKLGRAMGMKPMQIAEILIGLIPPLPEIESITAAPPGFINFKLKSAWLDGLVELILAAGDAYGNIDFGHGTRVQVEFVSINPTGPLHAGHGRGAVLGSTLCNVLQAAGFNVEKEYYFNDAGNQMQAFYRSLYARYNQALGVDVPVPEDGYHGNYMIDLARQIIDEKGNAFLKIGRAHV
jgi:arginyl-tRNA synthetase